MHNQSMCWWILTKCFWSFLHQKKIREKKFENVPFSFGDETYGDNEQGTGILNTPNSFRDETYGDVKMSGYNVRGHIVWERNIRGRTLRGCIILVLTKQARDFLCVESNGEDLFLYFAICSYLKNKVVLYRRLQINRTRQIWSYI